MVEPIYTFVKGKGWIVVNTQATARMSCGTLVKLEQRIPVNGEAWMRVSEPTGWLDVNGIADMPKFIEALENYTGYSELYDDRAHRADIVVEVYRNYPQGFVTVTPV